MTNIHDIIKQYNGDKPWEPRNVEEDYKEFKDYTYDIKMSIKDINYLLYLLEDYGRETNGASCTKARFWKILLDSGVNIEVKEKVEKYGSLDFLHERMFARPPFGCVKNRDKSSCELSKSKGCDVCEFNCIEELELSGKQVNENLNFVGVDNL